jgi:hypothetical protein
MLTICRKQQAKRHELAYVHYSFDTQADIATIHTNDVCFDRSI